MLNAPVFDTFDEDIAYYGWTDNVSFLKSTLPAYRLPSLTKSSTPKRAAVQQRQIPQSRIRNLSSSNTFFDDYEQPISYELRFNSLRSGPFGDTDPLLSKLFGKNSQDSHSPESSPFSDDNSGGLSPSLHNYLDATLHTDNNEELSEYLETLFLPETEPSAARAELTIPGELQAAFYPSAKTSAVEKIDANFWNQSYASTTDSTAHSQSRQQHDPTSTGVPDSMSKSNGALPTYELPGIIRHSKKHPQKRNRRVPPAGYLMANVDCLHV